MTTEMGIYQIFKPHLFSILPTIFLYWLVINYSPIPQSWILILIITLPELFFAISFFLILWKNRLSFARISIHIIDFPSSNFHIWLAYIRARSFSKIYNILSSSKRSKKWLRLLILFIFWLLDFSLRLFILIKDLKEANWSITNLYLNKFSTINGKKIEIYHKQIFLNCKTPIKIVRFLKIQGIADKQTAKELILNLKEKNNNFDELERKNCKYAELQLASDANINLKIYHYYYPNQLEIERAEKLNLKPSLHATSNIKFPLSEGQILEGPMGDAIKEGSANAGTVITIVPKLKFAPKKIYIPTYQIDGVYYFHQDIFIMGDKEQSYQRKKHNEYSQIITKKIDSQINLNQKLIGGLMRNEFKREFDENPIDIFNKIVDEDTDFTT